MSAAVIRPADRPGDLGWVVQAHAETYAAEYGWGRSFEALVSQIVAEYAENQDSARESAWIAEVDGERVGSVFCVRGPDEATAKLRLLLLTPGARGHGLGGRLVDTCLDFARDAEYKRIVLWTNDPLAAARAIYVNRGFVLTGSEPHALFGEGLTSLYYELDLA